MIDNHTHEALLIRFADGLATPDEVLQVDELLTNDKTAIEFLRQLEITQSWLQKASAVKPGKPSSGITDYVSDYTRPVEGTSARGRLSLVATLLAGLVGGAFLGANYNNQPTDDRHVQSETGLPEWVRLVADYHRLYSRKTLIGVPQQRANTVSDELSQQLGRTLVVPDLSEIGITFKREQELVFNEQRIIQLVYLPEIERPIAVCILVAQDAAESQLVSGTHAKMQYAYWQV